MQHPREQREENGEEKALAPLFGEICLKLIPLLAVAALLYLFMTRGVIVALAAFLWIAVLSYLGSLLFRIIKRSGNSKNR